MKNRIRTRLAGAMTLWLLPFSLFAYTAADYYQGGLPYYRAKNYPLAERYFAYALKLDPNNYQAAQMLGYAESGEGKIRQAIADLQTSLKIQPNNLPVSQYLATLQAALGPSAKPTMVPTAISEVMPATIAASATTITGSTSAEITAPVSEVSAPVPNNYVWDPAVDPYPSFTGRTLPLPKQVLITPTVYVDLSYAWTYAYTTGNELNDYGGGSTSYFWAPQVEVHFQLDPNVSLALGTEFWPKLTQNNLTVSENPGYATYTEEEHDQYQFQPVYLGIFAHSWVGAFSFDSGANLVADFFQNKFEEESSQAYVGGPTYDNQEISTDTGFLLGLMLQADLTYQLDPKNQFGLFLSGKAYFSPVGFSTIHNIRNDTTTNPPAPPSTLTSDEGSQPTDDSWYLTGFSLGLGLRAGF
jgi:tetratricopeptide (TPR) repeat protein